MREAGAEETAPEEAAPGPPVWRRNLGVLSVAHVVTVGIGGGQTSRVEAVRQAISRAGDAAKGAVLASDAFFPFRDSIDRASDSPASR